jgi:hypothetical protein
MFIKNSLDDTIDQILGQVLIRNNKIKTGQPRDSRPSMTDMRRLRSWNH